MQIYECYVVVSIKLRNTSVTSVYLYCYRIIKFL